MKALPKSALVEKQVLLHTGRREVLDEEGEVIIQVEKSVLNRREFHLQYKRGHILRFGYR